MRGTGTLSDLDTRALTPDQMNLDYNTMLASKDYMTHSEGATSTMEQTGSSLGKSGDQTHSAADLKSTFGVEIRRSVEQYTRNTMDSTTTHNQSEVRSETMHSTTDFSQLEDLAQAMKENEEEISEEADESAYSPSGGYSPSGLATHSNQDLQLYLDSLEATNNLAHTGRLDGSVEMDSIEKQPQQSRTGPLTVSVTIPSMDQTQSASEESAGDVSEIAMN